MSKKSLIKEYRELYSTIRKLANDDEIFPELNDVQLEEFISQEDWMGVPSFSISKQQMTNSDEAHIGLAIREDNRIWLTLWYNGLKAVERFTNILHKYSEKERHEFIASIKNLEKGYIIRILYAEKFYAGSADWETIKSVNCKDLSEEQINDILKIIKETKEKRDFRQKVLTGGKVATIAISIAEIVVHRDDTDKIKSILDNLIKLIRVSHGIKTHSQIKKIEKEKNRKIKVTFCSDCCSIFPHNTYRTICPKCKLGLDKNKITNEEMEKAKDLGKVYDQ